MENRKYIEISNLSVKYGDDVVIDNASLNIPKGKVTVVLGLSGVGKTSLLNAISGIIEYSGKIILENMDIKRADPIVGYVGQDFGSLKWKTVKQNIMLGRKIKKTEHDKENFKRIIDLLKIDDLMNRYPSRLSGGQNQRVKLASVFYLMPNIMLLDEPFLGLDMITRGESQNLLHELIDEYAPTVLLVTHDLNEAFYIGDRIIIFSDDGFKTYEKEDIEKFDKDKLKAELLGLMKGDTD